MATSTIFNFNFNNSEIVDSTGQWYNATTGTPTTEFIEHDGNTALFQPARTRGNSITPNPTMFQSYDPNFSAYTYTLEVQVCAVLNRVSNNGFILNFPNDEVSDYNATALGLWYKDNYTLEMWIDYNIASGSTIRPVLIDFKTAGFDRWFSVRIERTVDPNNPYIGATVKAYVDGAEVYNRTFTYVQSTARGKISTRLRYCEDKVATGGIAIDNLKLTAGIPPSSVVDVSLANLQRNNANLLSFIKGKVPTVNDGTLTIQRNGTNVATFTANASTNATANITVPTAVSELANDSGYLTASSNLDASKLTSGTVDIERLPQGALERLVKVANEAARYALTTADVQLGDTVQQLDTGIMYVVTDTDHLDSAAGYTEYTAGTAASVPWSGVTGKPTFAAVATSGAYSDLTGTPTIPTVNDATLTIQRNGTTVDTFTANASVDKTINISTADDTKIPLAGSNQISGDLIPATTDAYDLGGVSYQWNNAYIKSLTINGVACGDILTHNVSEFVNLTNDQTINGSKYFTSLLSKSNTLARGTLPTTNINEDPIFVAADKNNRRTLAFFNYYNTNGDGRVVLYAYNQNTTNYDNIGLVFGFDNANSSKSVHPVITNTCGLGSSANKWKSLNGINPGALSLPSTNLINIASSITSLDGVTLNKFTPQVDGWLLINGTGTANGGFIYVVQGRLGMMSANNTTMLRCAVSIPVVAEVEVSITCKLNTLTWANITPCQGNV